MIDKVGRKISFNIETNKRLILSMLNSINRDGISDLVSFLNESDYFTAPASSNIDFHACYEGGLAYHSLNVTNLLISKLPLFNLEEKKASATLIGLLHDLCKVNLYHLYQSKPTQSMIDYLYHLLRKHKAKIDDRMTTSFSNCKKAIEYYKNDTLIGTEPKYETISYLIKDLFPYGHGEKSAFIISKYIKLTEEEALCIKYHTFGFDSFVVKDFKSFNTACSLYPLIKLTITSDLEATLFE